MPEAAWCPNEEEVAAFRHNGWLASPVFLPEELLDTTRAAVERYLAETSSTELPDTATMTDLRRREGAALDHLGYLSLQLEAIRRLIAYPPLAAAAARLARTDGIRLFHDRLIVKPPHSAEASTVGWHVDRAYWLTCSSREMLTAWIPFDDVTEGMGELIMVSGSHRLDQGTDMATAHRFDMDRLLAEAGVDNRPELQKHMLLKRGQVSFHHCLTLHGSLPNRSEKQRAALVVHLQPIENHYRLVLRPTGRRLGHTNDLLCRTDEQGLPDYADPAIFPQLWPIP